MAPFSVTVALGAVLLFLVQPMVAKAVLPWFGGSAAVWTTSQLFFQLLLLGGYAWTHGLVTRLSGRAQVRVQLGLVTLAMLGLAASAFAWGAPAIPGVALRPETSAAPVGRLLLALTLAVGLPYFALATTGPLLQAWAARRAGASVYRLYAVSNAGSLLGLLAYPFALEPLTTLRVQGWLWAAGFAAWGVGLALAGRTVSDELATPRRRLDARGPWARWLALSSLPVVLLLAVTNHLTQEVAPVPFLWVLPLVAYLASFILTFESSRWYRRAWALPVLAALTLIIAVLRSVEQELPLPLRVALFLGYLFVACVTAHGELAASRPAPESLTAFYAALALGGALGGVFVGLVAPALFTGFVELELGLAALLVVLALVVGGRARAWLWLLVGLVSVLLGVGLSAQRKGVLAARRDFFGVVRVVASGDGDDEANLLMHGRTVHGAQQLHHRAAATTYYARESGVGQLLSLPTGPRRVGVIGLGIGTLASYGRAGDEFRFYELSPTVAALAQGEGGFFTFLADSRAQCSVALGDARTVLEHEAPNGFDVLVLDAFSSDSVPVHLLTKEAMALYLAHLAPDGVLALHLSNRTLSLVPIAAHVGRELQLFPAVSGQRAVSPWALPSRWLLLARRREALTGVQLTDEQPPSAERLWTDDASSLWSAVQW